MMIFKSKIGWIALAAGLVLVIWAGSRGVVQTSSSLSSQSSFSESEARNIPEPNQGSVSSGSPHVQQKGQTTARPYLHTEYVRVENEEDFSKRFQQACSDQDWELADRLLIAFAHRLNSNPQDLKPAHLRRTLEILEGYAEKEPDLVRHVPQWTEYRFTYRAMLGEIGEAQKAYSDLQKYHSEFMKKSNTCYPFYLTQNDPSVSWETQNRQVLQCLREGKSGADAVMDLLGPLLSKGEYRRARRVYSAYLQEFPNQGLIPLELMFRDVPEEDRN